MVRLSYTCSTSTVGGRGRGAGAVLGATLLSQAQEWRGALGLLGAPWPAQEPQGAGLVGAATCSEGCPGLSVGNGGVLLLRCDTSARVGSKRQSASTGLSKSIAGCLEPFLFACDPFMILYFQSGSYREIKESSRYLVLSLEVGSGYSIFHLEVCLFESLLLKVISFIFCGLLYPKLPLCAPSFCVRYLKSQDLFLATCSLKVLSAF